MPYKEDIPKPEDIEGRFQKTERELREFREKFRVLFETVGDAVFLIKGKYIVECNSRAPEIFRCRKKDILGKIFCDSFSPYVQPDGCKSKEKITGRIKAVLEGKPQVFEWKCSRLDGDIFDAEMRLNRVVLDDGNYIIAVVKDITDKKRNEKKLERIHRALKTLSECNAVLVHASGEIDLLNEICRIIVEFGEYCLAWVGYTRHDKDKTVYPVAQAGYEEGYLETVRISWADTEDGRGPTGTAIRTGKPAICKNTLVDPDYAPWREEAVKRGYAFSIALPIIINNEAIGALNIYATEPYAFDEEEVKLLMGLADDLAYGIMALRTKTKQRKVEKELQESAEKLHTALIKTIEVISLTLEKRDPYTSGHQKRVAELSVAIAREMHLPEDLVEGLRFGAMIHDIGKIYVPSEILNRPGKLTEVEYTLIKTHPQVGYEIVKSIEFPWPVAEMILQHHERMDGSGYPQGLKGEEIILEARILAVADVVEAMASHRPYRPASGIEKALDEILKNRGKLYDPDVVDACLRLFREKGFRFGE